MNPIHTANPGSETTHSACSNRNKSDAAAVAARVGTERDLEQRLIDRTGKTHGGFGCGVNVSQSPRHVVPDCAVVGSGWGPRELPSRPDDVHLAASAYPASSGVAWSHGTPGPPAFNSGVSRKIR